MTIADIISRVNDAKPNAYSEAVLCGFLSTLDGRVQREVWLRLPPEMIASYDYGKDRDKEPLMPAPYDEAYFWYLCAMVDLLNGEYTKAQNTMQLANDQLTAYQNWFISTYEPAQAGPGLTLLGSVDYTAGGAVELCTLPAGALLLLAVCTVSTAFDGGALALGTAEDDDALMGAGDITTTASGNFAKAANLTGGAAGTKLFAKFTGTATRGAAAFYARILGARWGWEAPA